ncbi:MAG: hypothetical protein EZS28_020696 [Streblomastix strix]|uniref:Uncharacterized protein n=1 Tax=Streblomastix strix TaxID=222440 RepID=A0A5J4VN89_9EUKA|nr:MAG: hypothetical protein EZS28_020696 [Streblomastix strix]
MPFLLLIINYYLLFIGHQGWEQIVGSVIRDNPDIFEDASLIDPNIPNNTFWKLTEAGLNRKTNIVSADRDLSSIEQLTEFGLNAGERIRKQLENQGGRVLDESNGESQIFSLTPINLAIFDTHLLRPRTNIENTSRFSDEGIRAEVQRILELQTVAQGRVVALAKQSVKNKQQLLNSANNNVSQNSIKETVSNEKNNQGINQ